MRQIADAGTGALVDGEVGDFPIVDVDVPLIRNDKPRRHIERRCLSGTVRSEQSHDFPLPHMDAYPVGYRTLPVPLHQLLRPEHTPLLLRTDHYLICL